MGLPVSSFLLFFLVTAASSLRGVSKTTSCSANFFEDHPELHADNATGGIFLSLHHAHGPCSPLDQPLATASEILHHDTHRVNHLTSRLLSTNKSSTTHHSDLLVPKQSSVNVPLSSGLSFGVGNYVTKVGLGTPSRDYVVVVDTGSSLSWLQCQPCVVSCYAQTGPVFNPKASSSYSPVGCSAPECSGLQKATLNPSSCSKKKVCIYQASYGDSSYSVGYLGKDSLSLASSKNMLHNFVYGCGEDNEGLFGKAAGLVGLAKDKLSMLGQIAKANGAYAFSHCLPSTSSSGYLSLGSVFPASYSFTPMVSNPSDNSLYYIRLAAITVGGKGIRVPESSYSSATTIIDSGTVITRLPTPIYSALSKAVAASLSKHARAPGYSILDTCFKGSVAALPVPPVSLVFAGGAEMKLSPRNVFYDLNSKGMTCLAFAASNSVAIIGNQQQQTFNVAYDVSKSRIGFAAGGCK